MWAGESYASHIRARSVAAFGERAAFGRIHRGEATTIGGRIRTRARKDTARGGVWCLWRVLQTPVGCDKRFIELDQWIFVHARKPGWIEVHR